MSGKKLNLWHKKIITLRDSKMYQTQDAQPEVNIGAAAFKNKIA
jgi:hypothetical protein